MKIKLTEEQLKEIEQEKIKEENTLGSIPKLGHYWDIVDSQDKVYRLTELLENKEVDLYN